MRCKIVTVDGGGLAVQWAAAGLPDGDEAVTMATAVFAQLG